MSFIRDYSKLTFDQQINLLITTIFLFGLIFLSIDSLANVFSSKNSEINNSSEECICPGIIEDDESVLRNNKSTETKPNVSGSPSGFVCP